MQYTIKVTLKKKRKKKADCASTFAPARQTWSVCRVHLCAGDLFEAVQLLREVWQSYGVVQDAAGAVVVAVGAAHDANHR